MKKYDKPEFEIIEFTVKDVLAVSNYDNDKEDPGDWFGNSPSDSF